MFEKIKENLKKFVYISFLFSIGSFLFISLISFSPADNNFFSFDSSLTNNKNLMGPFGSIVSSLLFQIFGYTSYIVPFFFFVKTLRIFYHNELTWYSWAFLPITLVFFCFSPLIL